MFNGDILTLLYSGTLMLSYIKISHVFRNSKMVVFFYKGSVLMVTQEWRIISIVAS